MFDVGRSMFDVQVFYFAFHILWGYSTIREAYFVTLEINCALLCITAGCNCFFIPMLYSPNLLKTFRLMGDTAAFMVRGMFFAKSLSLFADGMPGIGPGVYPHID